MATPLPGSERCADMLQKINYTHDAMVDKIVQQPDISHIELGLYFGYTAAWIGSVVNSDAFQVRLAERKTELVDPVIRQSLEERFSILAHQSLNVIQKKLASTESADLATKALELSSKALGLGARDRGTGNTNVTFVVALPEKAENQEQWAQASREDAARRAGIPRHVVDVADAVEIPQQENVDG